MNFETIVFTVESGIGRLALIGLIRDIPSCRELIEGAADECCVQLERALSWVQT
jgi:hypothetical protein